MSKTIKPSCGDCYFRNAGLCALPGETPCPTFRARNRGSLRPPRHPQLVLRELAGNRPETTAA